jgi:hypothetical protein
MGGCRMIYNAAKKLRFERFLLPDEKIRCFKKAKGLKKGKVYKVLQYVPDKVLVKNTEGINSWYKTKYFKSY